MIHSPNGWEEIGRPIELKEIEDKILEVVSRTCCNCLALSGGLDSSLMLYFMLQTYGKVRAFTIGYPEDHPDIKYSVLVAEELGRTVHSYYIPTQKEIEEEASYDSDFRGDKATRMFYRFVSEQRVSRIISCDGIDEYMAGYYDHQRKPNEETYYRHIRQLQGKQLIPLNKNSGRIAVYLPYLHRELLYLLCQIPTYEKVNKKDRKILMVEMARDKIPDEIINRRKYGFCDALAKGEANENKT